MENWTVLLLSFHSEKPAGLAEAFRRNGFEVVSVGSPAQARYEIQMGRCGVFVTCPLVSDLITADLVDQFKKNCPTGLVVCPMNSRTDRSLFSQADIEVDDSDIPEHIVEAVVARTKP
jgi:hypothetical protein